MGSALTKPIPKAICLPMSSLGALNDTWKELGRIDSWFQPSTLVNSTAKYMWLPNGTLDILNQGIIQRTGSPLSAHAIGTLTNVQGLNTGGAQCPPGSVYGDLSVKFDSTPFEGSYMILDAHLSPPGDPRRSLDYLIVGTRDANLLWALVRNSEPVLMSNSLLEHAKTVALNNGYKQSVVDKFHSSL